MPKEVINKPPEWLLKTRTLEKFLWTRKISARPWQVATVDWALSVHCSPFVSPGSDNILCFPTHQSFDSAKNKEQTDSPTTFALLPFLWSPVCEPVSEPRNAKRARFHCGGGGRGWRAPRKSAHETSQKALLNHILNTEPEGWVPSNLPL